MKKKNSDNDLVTKGFLKSYLKEELTKFRDKILNAVDAVMKEVVAMREEQTVQLKSLLRGGRLTPTNVGGSHDSSDGGSNRKT